MRWVWLFSDSVDGVDMKCYSANKRAVSECERCLKACGLEHIEVTLKGNYFFHEEEHFWFKIERIILE